MSPCKRSTRWLVIAALLMIATAPATAQSIFKCVGRDGAIAFQQVACPRGVQQRQIEIAEPGVQPVAIANVDAPTGKSRKSAVRTRQPRASTPPLSYRCTSASGAVFYRHARCPGSIPRASGSVTSGTSGGKSDPVRSTPIARRDACRQIGAFGRTGRKHDETVSTYERNAGRDPCRRY